MNEVDPAVIAVGGKSDSTLTSDKNRAGGSADYSVPSAVSARRIMAPQAPPRVLSITVNVGERLLDQDINIFNISASKVGWPRQHL